jgi:hypothetical protein
VIVVPATCRVALLISICCLASCGRRGVGGRDGGQAGQAGLSGGGAAGQAGGGAGGGAGTGGGAGAGGGAGTGGAPGADGGPIFTRVQRLTKDQWERAVGDILRFGSPARLLPARVPTGSNAVDFTNNEKLLFVDLQAELDFESGSEAAAAQATGSAAALAKLYAGTDAAGFVRALGRRAFRRPLTTDEETRYQGVFALGEQLYGAGFANGAALVIRAMLASPKFLYRSELGPAGQPLDGYEIASKLSFWLLGTTPSDELLDMAAAGGLDAVDGVETVARAMLERPGAVEVMRDFHGQLHHLSGYDGIDDARASAALRAEISDASARFFDTVFERDEGLQAILTSTRYFVGPGLASNYGVDAPTQIEERVLDPSRIGYFMQVPFLLLNGFEDEPDTIARGVAIDRDVLCVTLLGHTAVPPPLPALAPGQTNRDRIEALTASCTGCHADSIDPLGFAFEGFDGMGQARLRDNHVAVDTAASYPFDEGTRTFAGAAELMRILAASAQAHACYARKLTGYALQRDIVDGDRAVITDLAKVSRDRSLKEMVIALVRNPAFRLRAEDQP